MDPEGEGEKCEEGWTRANPRSLGMTLYTPRRHRWLARGNPSHGCGVRVHGASDEKRKKKTGALVAWASPVH